MSQSTAISFEGVSKRFRRGEIHDSLRDLIPAITGKLFQRSHAEDAQAFWALQDVSFSVEKGEAFGIIGENGAGKSTILKLLSGIMNPTEGRIQVDGRLSALIEVGAGFHPDLTGRENVYLNGAILGMSRNEIRRKFDEIVAFSGLEEFLDTPVKRYSSGMYARLGFSVAAHVDPDVLIVDEVLSVGDWLFQRRCAEKMAAIINSGATVVFVSHNLRAVAELCGRTLLLQRGEVRKIGPTQEVVSTYFDSSRDQLDVKNKDVYITGVSMTTSDGSEVISVEAGERVRIDIDVEARNAAKKLNVELVIRDDDEYRLFNTSTERLTGETFDLEPGERFRCSFEVAVHLGEGAFHVAPIIFRYDTQHEYDRWRRAGTFFVKGTWAVKGGANLYPRVLGMQRLEVEAPSS